MPDRQGNLDRRELGILTGSRLFINTGLRMVYPFLPALARGLGVSVESLALLVSLRGFTSLLSPIFGPLSDRVGRRILLVVALIVFVLGCLIILVKPTYWMFGLSLSVIATAKVIYDPAMQASIGDRIAYNKRGRALAITELSWAGSFFLGVPLIGFIMEAWQWQAPFVLLALLGLIAAICVWRVIPAGDGRSGNNTHLGFAWRIIRDNKVIWISAVYILLVMGANELLLIVYGEMMETNFALSLSSLGLATAIIGGAEISGEVTTALFVDRLGKRPFVMVAGLMTCLMYIVLPFSSTNLATSLISLFTLFLFFEMSVVGSIPLMTELVPSSRGVVMSTVLATSGLGRGIGALIGPWISEYGGFKVLGIVAASIMLVAIMMLGIWIRESQGEHI